VIVAGALKHIDQCEAMVTESIKTNILGMQNITNACIATTAPLKKMLLISTDKACSPVNVYGMCKALAERVVTHVKDSYPNSKMPDFLCVRYGNVLNSRGSLIPKFAEIGSNPNTKAFPITDESMTRFFMTLDHSVDLIVHALLYGSSGETWIPQVSAIKISELAKYFSNRYKKPWEIVGKRPGEKLHECLINECEIERTDLRTIEKKQFYVIRSSLSVKPTQGKPVLTEQYESSKTVPFVELQPEIEKILR
jgi:FlaA1/EpsC-like NDP-sugar epimerase